MNGQRRVFDLILSDGTEEWQQALGIGELRASGRVQPQPWPTVGELHPGDPGSVGGRVMDNTVDQEYVKFQAYQLSDRETAKLLLLRSRVQNDESGLDRADEDLEGVS